MVIGHFIISQFMMISHYINHSTQICNFYICCCFGFYQFIEGSVKVEGPLCQQQNIKSFSKIAELQNCRIADLQNCKISELQNCKMAKFQISRIAELQNCKIAKLQNCKMANLQIAKLWNCKICKKLEV